MFKIGDRVRIKETAVVGPGASHLRGKEFTIIEDDGTDCSQYRLDIPQVEGVFGGYKIYGDEELELVYNLDFKAGTAIINEVNAAFDSLCEDVPSFRLPSGLANPNEDYDWQEKACENITAVQKAYQAGLADRTTSGIKYDPWGEKEHFEYMRCANKLGDTIPKRAPIREGPWANLEESLKGRTRPSFRSNIVPELAAECLRTATQQHYAYELYDLDIGKRAAQIYKEFLKELGSD